MKPNLRFLYLLLLGTLILISSCKSTEPILVGVSVELTGRQSAIGVNVRNGIQIAVDELNASGGIEGRPIELVIRDDMGDPDVARQVDQELIDLGVVAIVGHITSGQTEAVFDLINEQEVVLISPTTSSDFFSDIDDYFFRLTLDASGLGMALAEHIENEHDVDRVVAIFDQSNTAFTKTLMDGFFLQFNDLRAIENATYGFISGETNLQELMEQVLSEDPDALLFVSSAVDTAFLVQYARQSGFEGEFFSSTWAQQQVLIETAGAAGEGMEFGAIFNPNNDEPAYLDFANQYQNRYGQIPEFGAVFGYETMIVLIDALRITGGVESGLPDALLQTKDMQGVQGTISLDDYGDVIRDTFVVTVQDHKFQLIDTISPGH